MNFKSLESVRPGGGVVGRDSVEPTISSGASVFLRQRTAPGDARCARAPTRSRGSHGSTESRPTVSGVRPARAGLALPHPRPRRFPPRRLGAGGGSARVVRAARGRAGRGEGATRAAGQLAAHAQSCRPRAGAGDVGSRPHQPPEPAAVWGSHLHRVAHPGRHAARRLCDLARHLGRAAQQHGQPRASRRHAGHEHLRRGHEHVLREAADGWRTFRGGSRTGRARHLRHCGGRSRSRASQGRAGQRHAQVVG